jgi:hypothetical protein
VFLTQWRKVAKDFNLHFSKKNKNGIEMIDSSLRLGILAFWRYMFLTRRHKVAKFYL